MAEELHLQPLPLDLAWGEPGENLRRIEAAVRDGLRRAPDVPSESRLFVLPELTLTGFVTQAPSAFAIEPPHPHVARLRALARELKTGLIAGFPEPNPEDPARPFNALALIAPDGSVAARYRKMHLFTVGKSPEAASYSAGGAGVVGEYRGWKIALAVCFDVRFAGFFHAYARAGADLIVVSSCWIGGPHKTYQYRTLCSAHAILSQAYVAAVNRSGRDPFYEYDGSAYVFSPFGEDLFDGGPCRLDAGELKRCRGLAVRSADRESYPVS